MNDSPRAVSKSNKRKPKRSSKRSAGSKCLKIIGIVVIAAACGFAGFIFASSFNAVSEVSTFTMKDIGELATQAGYFTVVNEIDDSVKLWDWSVPLTDSRYLFSYDGTVKAGFDFEEIDFSVSEADKEIKIGMPPARLLSVEIDEDSLEIYDEKKNIFTPLDLDDIKESRVTMIDEIKDRAMKNGLLEQASINAKTLIRGFLAGQYDLSKYTVTFFDKE